MNRMPTNPELARICGQMDRAMCNKKYERVVALCSRLLANPASQQMGREALAVCYLNRGFSRRRLGDFQGGLDDAAQAARLNPRSFKPHLNAALIYAQDLQEYERALEGFDTALRLNPTCAEALSSRGLTKSIVGDTAGAEADLLAALALIPNHPDALCNLGNLHFQSGDVQKAADFYQKALGANPKDVEIRMNLALALDRIGARRAAAEVLRKDRRAIALWESKGGYPVRPDGSRWQFSLFVIVVVVVIALLAFFKMQMKGP